MVLVVSSATSVQAQTADTAFVTPRPLFTASDAVLAGAFGIATVAAAPADRYFTRELQDEARQANRLLNRGATVFRLFGHPGGLITGTGLYAAGLIAGDRRTEDLGLHTVGSIVVANTITMAIKVTAGRARPRKSPDRARNFKLFRGLRDDEYRAFPSGHASAAFAFASIMSAETSRWWPGSRWIIGPIVYGGAGLTGVTVMFTVGSFVSFATRLALDRATFVKAA